MKILTKRRMFTPGPTPLFPHGLVQPLVDPMHHRKGDFKSLFRSVQDGLRQIYKTRNDVLLLTCSGSGAMEAALTNLLAPGDKALVAVAGTFGERWQELAERFQVAARVIRVPYGESVSPEAISSALDADPEIAAVFVQAMETSTGAAMEVEKIGRAVRARGNAVLVVDAITGLGATPIETDEWGLDVVIGGSQKALMAPPGIAMVSISEKAWRRIERCSRPRYYFDLMKERSGQKEGAAAFTPAISLIQALKSSTDFILDLGVENLLAGAALQAGATRAAVAEWGLKIFPRHPSSAVTVFVPGVDPSRVITILEQRFGALISGGQGTLKNEIIRVGHLGYFDFLETLGLIGCLELALAEAGVSVRLGSGPRAALEFYRSFFS